MIPRHLLAGALAATLLLAATGCQTAYYGAMEKLGVHKRDILVDRVDEARDAQQAAKKQFASALEEFLAVAKIDGGALKNKYDTLSASLKRSEERAAEVHDRVAAIDTVAQALFREWQAELGQYSSASLKAQSERQLRATRARYATLIAAMRRAEDRMEPVLATFRDQVLYLKHNLNAQALASLDGVSKGLEQDIASLIAEMERSIAEADAFIKDLKVES